MTIIDFSVLHALAGEMALVVLTALASYVTVKLCAFFKVKRDGELGRIADQALAMGIAFAMSRLKSLQDGHVTVDAKSEIVANAANYVISHVPETLRALKLDADQLRSMIEARLCVAEGAAASTSAMSTDKAA